jgi:hypothetical protein
MSVDSEMVEEQALGTTLVEVGGGLLEERINGKLQFKFLKL